MVSVEALRAEIRELIDGRPIFESRMRPVRVVSLKNGRGDDCGAGACRGVLCGG